MEQNRTKLTTAKRPGRLWGMTALLAAVILGAGALALWYILIGAPAPPS